MPCLRRRADRPWRTPHPPRPAHIPRALNGAMNSALNGAMDGAACGGKLGWRAWVASPAVIALFLCRKLALICRA